MVLSRRRNSCLDQMCGASTNEWIMLFTHKPLCTKASTELSVSRVVFWGLRFLGVHGCAVRDVYPEVGCKGGFMCVIATYCFSRCFFLIPFCHWMFVLSCGDWCFGYCVATRWKASSCCYCIFSKGSLISTNMLLWAEKVNVVLYSAFKKLFEL